MGLPRSSFLAWSKHRHRLSFTRASDILTALGTSWQAFLRAGNTAEGAGTVPATVQASWHLLQALQAALPKVEVDLLLRATPEAITWIRFDNWHIAIQADGWTSLFKGGSQLILEGRINHDLQGEIVRTVVMLRRVTHARASKPQVYVSRLHSSMRTIHSSHD